LVKVSTAIAATASGDIDMQHN